MEMSQRDRRIQITCLLILTSIALAAALHWLRPVMVPFILAGFITVALAPLINFQARTLRLPRPLAVVTTLLLALVVLTVIGGLVSSSLRQLAANAGAYQARIQQLISTAIAALPLERFGLNLETIIDSFTGTAIGAVQGMLVNTTGAVLNVISQGLLVLLFVIFLLIGGTARQAPPPGVLGEVEVRVTRYIVTKILLSGATGILVGLILLFLDIDMALAFGCFAFLLNFIPSVGSVIATLLPLPVVLLTPDISVLHIVLALALPGAVQFLIGNVIEPKIMGDALDLHPVVILMALIFWGMLWGIMGMFLATPMTAILKIVLGRIERTAPVADLLAGRLDALQTE